MAYKVKITDLMKGAGFDWTSAALRENPGGAMPVRRSDKSAAEPVRYPTISESALNDFQNTEQEPMPKPKEMTKGQLAKIAEQRAEGNLPEQTPMRTFDRSKRAEVDESEAKDQGRVDELAKGIQGNADVTDDDDIATNGTGSAVGGYDDILRMMRENALSEGEMARRQHSREVVTGLGDLVSSIANLWATSKGAPNAYDNSKGMTATVQSRYDRELARRKAQNEQILNYYRVKKAAEDDAENREYKREMLEERRRANQANEDIRREQQESRERDNEAKRQIQKEKLEWQKAKTPGADVYYKTKHSLIEQYGWDEDLADQAAREELAKYNAEHGTKYTVVDKTDNSGRVTRTVTVKTDDAQAASQAEQASNENVQNTPPPATKKSSGGRKSGSGKKKSKDRLYGGKPKLY